MNKSELIQAVAEASGLTKKDSGAAVDAVFAALTEAMKKEVIACLVLQGRPLTVNLTCGVFFVIMSMLVR